MKTPRSAFRSRLAAVLFLLVPLAAPPLAMAATPPEAQPIEALDNALIATMKAGSKHEGFMQRYSALAPVVKSTFNLPVILKNSTGFFWATFPAAQQQELQKLFEQFTVASYISGFDSYNGQKIKLLPTERTVGDKKVVETEIVPADGGSPTRLDYVMTYGADGWQVTDVLLDGTISKVAVQTSDFSSEVSSGNASQLISALKSKVASLSGGALSD